MHTLNDPAWRGRAVLPPKSTRHGATRHDTPDVAAHIPPASGTLIGVSRGGNELVIPMQPR
jgi:hypothetical protein